MIPFRTSIQRLQLHAFRNHPQLQLAPEGANVVLTGANGAGKTNILEALSLFTPGRGLRRAPLGEMIPITAQPTEGWMLSIRLDSPLGEAALGTGIEAKGEGFLRRCRIEGENAPSPVAFSDYLRLTWLTPAMDGLFSGSAGDRRRFLDRLVLAIDPAHAARSSRFEKALRSRNKLLEEQHLDTRWLDALEREIAELAVAVAAARAETVARLKGLILETRDAESLFPWADIRIEGWMEERVLAESATGLEDHYLDVLKASRLRDKAAGRATQGPQTADLVVLFGCNGVPAARCSTGEQKALLMGIILAHAQLIGRISGIMPLLLLDEVVAHLDPHRRIALCETLDGMNVQTWVTGADPAAFAPWVGRAKIYEIASGQALQAAW